MCVCVNLLVNMGRGVRSRFNSLGVSILMTGQPSPSLTYPRQIHKGLIAAYFLGNQWVFISPKNKALIFFGGYLLVGEVD